MESLPNELMQNIFEKILHGYGWQNLFKLRVISKSFKNNIDKVLIKAKIVKINGLSPYKEKPHDFSKIFHRLYDRSPFCEEIVILNAKIHMLDLKNIFNLINLKSLRLNHVDISGKGIFKIRMNDLRSLDLSNSTVTNQVLMRLIRSMPNLTSLSYQSPFDLFDFYRMSTKLFDTARNLNSLTLDLHDFHEPRLIVNKMIDSYKILKITELSLILNDISFTYIKPLEQIKSLEILRLKYVTESKDFIDLPSITSLRILQLDEFTYDKDSTLNDKTMQRIAENYVNLKELYLSRRHYKQHERTRTITSEGVKHLVNKGSSLRKLHVKNMDLSNIMIEELANLIELEYLFLEDIEGFTYHPVVKLISRLVDVQLIGKTIQYLNEKNDLKEKFELISDNKQFTNKIKLLKKIN